MKNLILLICLVLLPASKLEKPEPLLHQYVEFNETYFDNKLPKNTIIDRSETNTKNMASTSRMSDGRFHIAMNDKYTAADRVANITLLHEMCHIRTADEWPSEFGDQKLLHGPKWKACMISLDFVGAFRVEIIDNYQEKP